MERKIQLRLGILGVFALVLAALYLPGQGGGVEQSASLTGGGNACAEGALCVSFLDIGQGDATFIESPEGVQVLIDGGPGSSVISKLAEVMNYFDRDIDMVIPTHPDADHISGLVDVFDRFDVGTVVMTENENDTAVFRALKERIETEDADVIYARRGQTYDLGGGATLEILFPETDASDMESNESSIVARLTYGDTSFLFTGDSPKRVEEYLVLAEGEHLQSDVLKVGHHGSRTSTSDLFLAEVAPTYAIISAGKDNRYGHPHVEVTDLLFNYGVITKNTADEGSIYMVSDGLEIGLK